MDTTKSFPQILIDFAEEELVHLRVLFHFVLPGRSLVSLHFLQNILEIVKCKYPCAFVEDKQRQIVHLHIYLRSQSYFGSFFGDRCILHNKEFVLQTHIFFIGRGHLKVIFFHEGLILVDSFGVQEETASLFHAVVADGVEIGFPVGEEWDVYFAGANSLIPADFFKFLTVIAEGDILTHQIYLRDNGQKLYDGDVKFPLDSYCNLLLLLEDFILQSYSFALFIENPAGFVELLVKSSHGHILLGYSVYHCLSVLWDLTFF